MIKVLFFGPVAERMGMRSMQLDFSPGMRLQDVTALMTVRNPQAMQIVCFTAVNDQQANDMQVLLADDDEIAFMAKFSGG